MEERQQEMLSVAIKEFATNGYYKTKMEIIAEKADVSKGLVFHYYKSKKNLYVEAIREVIRRLEKTFDFNEFPVDSLINLFDYSIKKKFEIAEEYQAEMQLMLDIYSDLDHLPLDLKEEIMMYIETVRESSYEVTAQIIRKMPIKEEIQVADVVSLVLMVFNQIEQNAKLKMMNQKVVDLHFFDQMLVDGKKQLRILETGFLK